MNRSVPLSGQRLLACVESFVKQRLLSVSLLAVLLLPATNRAAASEMSLEVLRAGYEQTVSSMQSVWTRCEHSVQFSNEALADASFEGLVIEWAFDGRGFHHHRYGPPDAGKPLLQHRYCSDGETVWAFNYSEESGYTEVEVVWRKRYAAEGNIEFLRETAPGIVLGLGIQSGKHPLSDQSLSSLLSGPEAELVGRDTIGEHACWHVDLGEHRNLEGEVPIRLEVWLDPEAGYLPRRIMRTRDGELLETLEVHEFQQAPAGVGSGTVWFPRRCQGICDSWTWTLNVHEVTVNEPLDRSLFRPRIPSGVPVLDADDKQAVDAWFASRAEPLLEERAAERQARIAHSRSIPQAAPLPTPPAIDARPPSGRLWRNLLLVGGLVCLSTGALLFWRRQ